MTRLFQSMFLAVTMLFVLAVLSACATQSADAPIPANVAVSRPGANGPFLGAKSELVAPEPVPGAWWKLYDDERLDALVERALEANTDLRVAAANIRKAEAGYDVATSAKEPSTSVGAGVNYGRLSAEEELHPGKPFPNKFTYGTGFGVSYQLDLFGQIARSIDAAQADVGAAVAARDAARVTVAAETSRAYLEVCAAGREIGVAQRLLGLQSQSTALTRTLAEHGRATSQDTDRSIVQEQQVKATLPGLESQRRVAIYRLAVLTGQTPADFADAVESCVQEPGLERALPVGDGAALLRRRPDVRRAEFEVQGAWARIGVVKADLYPKVVLGASLGSVGALSHAFEDDTVKFSVGPLISWEFPNRSRTQARIRGADADFDASLARFDGVVLGALKETESALEVYARDRERRDILDEARGRAQRAADDSHRLFAAGRTGFLPVLDADRTLASVEQSVAAADSRLASDQVNLFLALGGGWQQADDAVPASAGAAHVSTR
jgi:NodT family efflux transporter outer membrane factor (OMF) lipoprotein